MNISTGWLMLILGILGVAATLILQVILIRVFAHQKRRVIEEQEEA